MLRIAVCPTIPPIPGLHPPGHPATQDVQIRSRRICRPLDFVFLTKSTSYIPVVVWHLSWNLYFQLPAMLCTAIQQIVVLSLYGVIIVTTDSVKIVNIRKNYQLIGCLINNAAISPVYL